MDKLPSDNKFKTLKAWVHWVIKNPLSDDQELMAKNVNDLFSLLGNKEAEIEKLTKENEGYKNALEESFEELKVAADNLCNCKEAECLPTESEVEQAYAAARACAEALGEGE